MSPYPRIPPALAVGSMSIGTDADMQSLSRWEHCSVLHCSALAALLYTDEIHFLDTHRPAQRQLMGVDAWKSNREIEDQRLAGIAGVSILTSLTSALSGRAVHRDIAMTGELTLTGRVLAIGGLKEKLLSALRGGIKTVIIPEENEKDLAEIPDNVKEGLKIIPVSNVKEVLKIALAKMPK